MTKSNPADLERAARALAAAGGNKTRAAAALKIPRSTLQNRLKQQGASAAKAALPKALASAPARKVEPTVASTRVTSSPPLRMRLTSTRARSRT